MKAFSSSILSTKQAPITESTSTGTFESFESGKSTLVKFLEFNEAAAEADIKSTRDFYLRVLATIRSGSGNYDPALNACFTQYEAVKNAINNCMHPCGCCIDKADEYTDLANKLKKLYPSEMISQVVVDTKMSCVDDDAGTAIFTKYCEDIISGKEVSGRNMINEIPNYLSKCAGLGGAETIEDLLDQITNSYNVEEREITLSNYYTDSVYKHIWIYPGTLTNKADLVISYLKVNADKFENPNTIREIVKNICDALSIYCIAYLKSEQIAEDVATEVRKANITLLHKFDAEHGSVAESMLMFGDEVTSKSIFDDLDPDDFNPTEFMNLELVSEHAMKMDSMETYKWAMAMEAKYLSEQNYQGLVDLNEAVGQKIKEGFGKVIEALKKIAAKFVEAILFNFGTEKAWLTKYKNVILNNNLKADTQIAVYCNLKNAVEGLQDIECPTTNYNELTSDTSAFESEEAFFEKKFQTVATVVKNTKEHIPQDASISDRVKYAYGAKYPNGESDTGTFADFGDKWPDIAKMYNWLLNTEKLARNTQSQIKNIERTVENYNRSANKLGAPENQQNATPAQGEGQGAGNNQGGNGGQVQTQESYYSYIYGKMLTEMDIKSAPANDGNATQNTTNNPNPKEMYKTTQGDTDEQVKNSKDSGSVITGRMNIYLNVCKQVLTAKMTAINYAHKEMLDLMRAIVKGRLGDSADIVLKPQNGDQKQETKDKNAENQQNNAQQDQQKSKIRNPFSRKKK